MVSGLVTSPDDQLLICFDEARPIEMASKLLMSIIRYSNWKAEGGKRKAGTAPRSRFSLRFHVFGFLLFGGRVRLAAVALGLDLLLRLVGRVGGRLADPGEVDAELLGCAQEFVVLVADLHAAALLGADVHVERERLHLLQEDLERLGDRRLGDVLAL